MFSRKQCFCSFSFHVPQRKPPPARVDEQLCCVKAIVNRELTYRERSAARRKRLLPRVRSGFRSADPLRKSQALCGMSAGGEGAAR